MEVAKLDPGGNSPVLPSLMTETRSTVGTATAAHYMNRRMQTLQKWHCYGGPIKPVVVNGRLAWPVAEIRKLMTGADPDGSLACKTATGAEK